jgi:hypothetical protein
MERIRATLASYAPLEILIDHGSTVYTKVVRSEVDLDLVKE